MHDVSTQGVVVVGAGPAGIVCALELAEQGMPVLLLESGMDRFSATIQELSDLNEFDSARQAPMSIATRRQFGGSSVIWGGRCVPFDPIDFQARPFVPHSDWPIGYSDVEKYHQRAAEYFHCGRAVFSTHEIETVVQKSIVPNLLDGDVLSSELERWSLPTDFGREYRRAVKANPLIRRLLGVTATKICMGPDGQTVDSIEGVNAAGEVCVFRGSSYVIACGGLETTRLLLQPADAFPRGLGNESDWLGKCYMGHLSGQIAQVRFSGDPKKTQYGFLRDQDGTYVRQRFTLSEQSQLEHEINNTAIWLVSPKIGDPSHGNGVLSFAYLALSSSFGRYFAPEAIRQAAIADAEPNATWKHVRNMLKQFPKTAAFIPTFGWKRFLIKRRIPGFFQYAGSNCYPLHYHAEQIPLPESRVTLSKERDRLGVFKIDVDLRFADQDIKSVIRAHQQLDDSLRTQHAGRIEYYSSDLEASVWEQARDGFHQAGTTRMALRSQDGVVDASCRVHGTKNLFVASSSVFCTSGQANSTFLIVALAIRLARHLALKLS